MSQEVKVMTPIDVAQLFSLCNFGQQLSDISRNMVSLSTAPILQHHLLEEQLLSLNTEQTSLINVNNNETINKKEKKQRTRKNRNKKDKKNDQITNDSNLQAKNLVEPLMNNLSLNQSSNKINKKMDSNAKKHESNQNHHKQHLQHNHNLHQPYHHSHHLNLHNHHHQQQQHQQQQHQHQPHHHNQAQHHHVHHNKVRVILYCLNINNIIIWYLKFLIFKIEFFRISKKKIKMRAKTSYL
jgi:hypothetical protein